MEERLQTVGWRLEAQSEFRAATLHVAGAPIQRAGHSIRLVPNQGKLGKIDLWRRAQFSPQASPPKVSSLQPKALPPAMFRVTREIEFCYGHRLLEYAGKCRHLHGHNGLAVIAIEGSQLDHRGMLVDFSDIKSAVSTWI